MSKTDPKPGRWILPIVIAALIGFTYLFVNALPAADVTASTSTTTSTTSTTVAPTTTSTTLPNDILAFLQELDRFEDVAIALRAELEQVNDDWENRDRTRMKIGEAEAGFTAVQDDAQELADQVGTTTVPEPFPPAWQDTIIAAFVLPSTVQDVIDGLLEPDDGSLRREAIIAYAEATAEFTGQLDAVRSLTP